MEKIDGPRQPGRYRERDIDCDEAMDIAITELVDTASRAGWSIPETLDAIARIVPRQRHAYEQDPDPADDPVNL